MRHTSVQRVVLKSSDMSKFFYRKKENKKDLTGTGMASVIHQYSFDSCTCADADVQCHVGRVNGVGCIKTANQRFATSSRGGIEKIDARVKFTKRHRWLYVCVYCTFNLFHH